MKQFIKSLLILLLLILISVFTFGLGLVTNQISDEAIPSWLQFIFQPPLIWVTIGGLVLLIAVFTWIYFLITDSSDTADRSIGQQIANLFATDKSERRNQRNRQVMLKMVKEMWVKGVLEKSLHGAVWL